MAEVARQALADAGVNPDRMSLEWASAAEGPRFVELITSYVNRIKGLGALGEGENEPGADVIARRLSAAVKAAGARKPRTAFGTLAKKLHKSGDYSPESVAEAVKKKVMPGLRLERISEEVLMCLKDGARSASELADMTGADDAEMEKALAALKKKKAVKENGKKGWALA
jgi:hypothetical protein